MNRDIVLYIVDSTGSTNQSLKMMRDAANGFVLMAHEQTQGKGMGTNSWESTRGKNICRSIVNYYPQRVAPSHAFVISMAVSVAIIEFLQKMNIHATIKWPNDIYINNKKLAGILIENEFTAQTVSRTIVGIGLNVNQAHFKHAPNPVSLSLLTSQTFDVEVLAHDLFQHIFNSLNAVDVSFEEIITRYHANLLGLNDLLLFEDSDGNFQGKIKQVDTHGNVRNYYFKEVSFCF